MNYKTAIYPLCRRSPSPVLTDNEEEDMSLSEDEEKTSASGEFIIDYGHRSLTGQKGKGGVDEWLKNIINLPTCISLQFYAIDIDLISSNYSMWWVL